MKLCKLNYFRLFDQNGDGYVSKKEFKGRRKKKQLLREEVNKMACWWTMFDKVKPTVPGPF